MRCTADTYDSQKAVQYVGFPLKRGKDIFGSFTLPPATVPPLALLRSWGSVEGGSEPRGAGSRDLSVGGGVFRALLIHSSVLCILSEYSSALPISSPNWSSGMSSTISLFKVSIQCCKLRLVCSNANSSAFIGVVSIRVSAWPRSLVAEVRWAFFFHVSSPEVIQGGLQLERSNVACNGELLISW